MTLVLVMVAAAVGAPLRYVVDQTVQHRRRGPFPAGTVTINVTGSLLLGLLTGLALHHGLAPQALTVLGTGLLGAYTTFSTFAIELVHRWQAGRGGIAIAYALASVAAGVLAAAAGAQVMGRRAIP